jgi:hypothetical protein
MKVFICSLELDGKSIGNATIAEEGEEQAKTLLRKALDSDLYMCRLMITNIEEFDISKCNVVINRTPHMRKKLGIPRLF